MVYDDYDAGAAFARIEAELIDSMMRNLRRYHLDWEDAEGFDWSQWQVEQLKYLEEYRQRNEKKYGLRFTSINQKIEEAIRHAEENGQKEEELRILRALADNKSLRRRLSGKTPISGAGDAFFRINDRKLEALVEATRNDLQRAEYAVLRRTNDQYRKIIFDAQVYANTGAGTIEKAVDMATHDFLARGIDCIEYKNGARHTISDWADMAVRTAERRAYLAGEGRKRQEWGISLVIVNRRGTMTGGNYGHACPQCIPWLGKILIDDVYSGGKPDGKHQLLSDAMAQGFLHPRCRDSFTTYFPGISSTPDPATREEVKEAVEAEKEENRENYVQRQAEKFDRLARYSLDPENKRKYAARAAEWKGQNGLSPIIQKIRNTESAEDLATVMQDITGKPVKLSGLDLDLMKRNMEQLSTLGEEYGFHFSEIVSTNKRAALGEVVRTGARGQTVTLQYPRKYYASRDDLLRELRKSASAGEMPRIPGRHIEVYTSTHEFAHTLAEELTARLYGHGKDLEFWDEIEEIYLDYKKNGGGVLGKYAASNQNEFLAEAFASAKLAPGASEHAGRVLEVVDRYFKKNPVANAGESGIIVKEKLAKYIGQPIVATDNQSVREWYVANVSSIMDSIDTTKPSEDQARQAFEMRNAFKHQARVAMSDAETAAMLEKRWPAPAFEELIDRKMKKKGMTREEAVADILKTATKTNSDVNKEFGL